MHIVICMNVSSVFSGGIWMSLVRLAEMLQFFCPRSQWFLPILGRFPDEFFLGLYVCWTEPCTYCLVHKFMTSSSLV